MYTLYGFPKIRSFRVLWALAELGVEYDYKIVDLYKGEHKSADYLKLSPAGKVPVLVSDDGAFGEISGYLELFGAEKHGAPLLPDNADFGVKGRIAQMASFVVSEMEQPIWNMAKHTFALPEERRVAAIKATAAWEYGVALETFANLLGERDYVAGESFSYADILAVHTLNWAKGAKQACPYENVINYQKRVMNRDAYVTAMAIEDVRLTELRS